MFDKTEKKEFYSKEMNFVERRWEMSALGKTSKRKKRFNSGIARITQNPPPNSGNFTGRHDVFNQSMVYFV